MGLLVGNLRSVTAGRLEKWVVEESGVKVFHPERRYFADLHDQPASAALLSAMQWMYLGTRPRDMSGYGQARTGEHIFAKPSQYFGFAGIFEKNARATLLGFFTYREKSPDVTVHALDERLRQELGEADFVKQFAAARIGRELPLAISIREIGDTIFMRPAELGRAKENLWRTALSNFSQAVDRYFAFPEMPQTPLPETVEYLRQTVPLLFSRESVNRALEYLSIPKPSA
jgi:hypothetical protein